MESNNKRIKIEVKDYDDESDGNTFITQPSKIPKSRSRLKMKNYK